MQANSSLTPIIRRLAKIRPGPHRVVSCYLRLEVEDRARGKYLIALKNGVKLALIATEGLATAERRPVERDLKRIVRSVGTPGRLPHAPGVALFACEGLELFEMIPMPRVHHTRVGVDRTPQIRELVTVEEEVGRLLVSLFDRGRARFFEVTAFEVRELSGLRAVSTRGGKFHSDRQDSPGWGERSFHHRIEEERHRHFAAIGRHLATLDRELPARGIVLAGPAEETRAATRFLDHALTERLMGTVQLNPTSAKPAEVRAASLGVRREFERTHERLLVLGMESRLGEGWAVNGAQPTLRALARGQVRTLFLRSDETGSGFRCADTGRLALARGECRGEGAPIPVPDLVNETIEEALHQRVNVVVIHEREARELIDGLAAILRFR